MGLRGATGEINGTGSERRLSRDEKPEGLLTVEEVQREFGRLVSVQNHSFSLHNPLPVPAGGKEKRSKSSRENIEASKVKRVHVVPKWSENVGHKLT